MKEIQIKDGFIQVMLLEKALIFVYFDWSASSLMGKSFIADWAKHNPISIPIFSINPEKSKLFSEWAENKVNERGGWGTLIWLKNGKILNIKFKVEKSDISEIERKTDEIFQN